MGIFPNDGANVLRPDCVYTRLVGAARLEQQKHWQLEGRRMFSAESMGAIPNLEDSRVKLSASA